jgi:hypothetical protein
MVASSGVSVNVILGVMMLSFRSVEDSVYAGYDAIDVVG